ncbi:unnamed protein product [Amoebophrya sp. A25]|nr:unnamed protein product [Amoebophrya sp. A25]|eukprot:GSA25T00010921001.1
MIHLPRCSAAPRGRSAIAKRVVSAVCRSRTAPLGAIVSQKDAKDASTTTEAGACTGNIPAEAVTASDRSRLAAGVAPSEAGSRHINQQKEITREFVDLLPSSSSRVVQESSVGSEPAKSEWSWREASTAMEMLTMPRNQETALGSELSRDRSGRGTTGALSSSNSFREAKETGDIRCVEHPFEKSSSSSSCMYSVSGPQQDRSRPIGIHYSHPASSEDNRPIGIHYSHPASSQDNATRSTMASLPAALFGMGSSRSTGGLRPGIADKILSGTSSAHMTSQRRGISFAAGDPFGSGGPFGFGGGGGRNPFGGGGGQNPFGNGGSGGGSSSSRATKKLYELLGVSEGAGDKEIKSAYKKKALEHHPDKGGNEETFKNISKAYDVLGNAEKRKMYDLYGDAGLQQMEQGGAGGGAAGMGGAHADPFEMFRDIFGQGFGGANARTRKTQDIVQKVKLSLEDIYKGVTKDYQLTRHVLCEYCQGHGGSEVRACSTCGGVGRIQQQQRMGPFVQFVQTECPACKGEGMVVPPGKGCKPCKGKGLVDQKEFFQITVPPTAGTGFVKKFPNKADEMLGCETGDLVFVVEELRHHTYHRLGQDLMIQKTLPLQDALCGFRFKLGFLDGEDIVVESNGDTVVQPGDVWRIPGRGMPSTNGVFGDLLVKFEILFPQGVRRDRDLFRSLGVEKSFYLPDAAKEEVVRGPNTGRAHTAERMEKRSRDRLVERLQRQRERMLSFRGCNFPVGVTSGRGC